MTNTTLVLSAAVAVAAAAGSASAQTGPWSMHDGWMGWWWPLGGLLWLAVIGFAIYGLVTFLRKRF